MKIYITARFKGAAEQRGTIEALCSAVRDAGMEDFCFIRDIEHYEKVFDEPVELWQRALAELRQCDGLLIDVSDAPTTGRVLEAGMAYALGLPIFVIVKEGMSYKDAYDGISSHVIRYTTLDDVTSGLRQYVTNNH